jgi:hypothetical protein
MRPLAVGMVAAVLLLSVPASLALEVRGAGLREPAIRAVPPWAAGGPAFWPDCVTITDPVREQAMIRQGHRQTGRWIVADDRRPLLAKAWRWRPAETCFGVRLLAGHYDGWWTREQWPVWARETLRAETRGSRHATEL